MGTALNQNNIILLGSLFKENYGRVICYPKYDLITLRTRIQELNRLGVNAIEFIGNKIVNNLPVLGKGCVGIVVIAHTKKGKVALKIRRMDADRSQMHHEADMLKKANAVAVGPKLLGVSKNFLLMEFIEGSLLSDWISKLGEKGSKSRIQRVLRNILEQCWRLDDKGLDHGELSNASKHIMIDDEDVPYLVDFETASIARKVSNVTSLCQYLFIGSKFAKTMKNRLEYVDNNTLLESLKNYKQQRTRDGFVDILRTCELSYV